MTIDDDDDGGDDDDGDDDDDDDDDGRGVGEKHLVIVKKSLGALRFSSWFGMS